MVAHWTLLPPACLDRSPAGDMTSRSREYPSPPMSRSGATSPFGDWPNRLGRPGYEPSFHASPTRWACPPSRVGPVKKNLLGGLRGLQVFTRGARLLRKIDTSRIVSHNMKEVQCFLKRPCPYIPSRISYTLLGRCRIGLWPSPDNDDDARQEYSKS